MHLIRCDAAVYQSDNREAVPLTSTLAQNNTIVSAELEPLRGHKTSLEHKKQQSIHRGLF